MMTLVIVSNKVKLGFLMGKIFQRKTTFEALTVFFKGFLKVDGVQRVTECTLVLDEDFSLIQIWPKKNPWIWPFKNL